MYKLVGFLKSSMLQQGKGQLKANTWDRVRGSEANMDQTLVWNTKWFDYITIVGNEKLANRGGEGVMNVDPEVGICEKTKRS